MDGIIFGAGMIVGGALLALVVSMSISNSNTAQRLQCETNHDVVECMQIGKHWAPKIVPVSEESKK